MNNQETSANMAFDSIIELIAADKLEEALSAIKVKGVSLPKSIADRIVMQSGRLARNKQALLDGRISRDNSEVERNRVAEAILGLIRELEASSEHLANQTAISNAELLVAARQLETGVLKSHGGSSHQLEAVHGINNLKSISWIEMGIRASRSVCRILIPTPSGAKFGTGFLIGLGRVMTNNHVIGSIEEARQAKLEFNYQLSVDASSEPTVRYDLDPDAFFHTSPMGALDYTVAAVRIDANKPTLEKWGALMLNADAEPILNELVAVVQHPNGQVKQVVLSASAVVQVKAPLLHYTSDTMGGSSGSPVFNDLWQVIAIHHAAGPNIGGIPTNEGILMSSIRPNLGANWPGK
ncbi:MAG TPA: trypsin-like peptidase domain-containing protein [Blastocatellia bacterium]|nr:trypsin-like peptidase domain-containing protein [Blastocatellia bacterium]